MKLKRLNKMGNKKLSKDVLIAVVGALCIFGGYFYNAYAQREQERFIRKLEAYENVLIKIESHIPIQDEDDLVAVNSASVIMGLHAPDTIIKRISDEVIINKENVFDRKDFRKLQLILHEDLHGKSDLINYGYFPTFIIGEVSQ